MQVSLDGSVKYAGHDIIKSKDDRTFVRLTFCDDENKCHTVFCDGNISRSLNDIKFGDEISIVFDVRDYNNNLNLRVKEIIC